jgi:two-component system response regulator YesN
MYKVFLVEDEIVTREGIRDNVDWGTAGFEFCGEAPDGEIALPLLEKTRPDVLLTDIKMPFMDGLQLCKIVRERMPWVKIIILSGHDEFQYAQEAVRLGVTEYLLKPVGVQDLRVVLRKVAGQLDREQAERESLRRLQHQIEDDLALRREKFLLKLAMGGMSSAQAIEESRRLELDLIAKWYQVMVVEFEPDGHADQFDYYQYEQVEQIIASLVGNNPDVYLSKQGVLKRLLLLKGDSAEYLAQEADFLAELIKGEVENKTDGFVKVGVGRPQDRIGHIYHSFAGALAQLHQAGLDSPAQAKAHPRLDQAELLDLDKSALEDYLQYGIIDEFDKFFEAYLEPLGEAALQSYLIRNYIFVDIILTTAKFVHQLEGEVDRVIPEINYVEALLMNIKTLDQLREETRRVLTGALAFRNDQAQNPYGAIIQQAKKYIEHHYTNPDLALNDAAAHVNLSPSHFSVVFSRNTGQTFIEYLTKLRIEKAKELLRTTPLKSFEIAFQIGYNDPHYFSYVFKKHTGLSPKQFRLQTRATGQGGVP